MIQSEYAKKNLIDFDNIEPVIIEVFVAYYGEAFRERIEANVKNAVVCPVVGYMESFLHDFEFAGHKISWMEKSKIKKEVSKFALEQAKGMQEKDIKQVDMTMRCFDVEDYATAEVQILRGKNGQTKQFVLFGFTNQVGDSVVVHEFIHVAEGYDIEEAGGTRSFCGLYDSGLYDQNGAWIKEPDREYMALRNENYFNELLTELKAQAICEELKEKGIVLISDVQFDCVYAKNFEITAPFLKQLIPYANQAIFTKNKEVLYDLFGGKEEYYRFTKVLSDLDKASYTNVRWEINDTDLDKIKSRAEVFRNLETLKKYRNKCDYINALVEFKEIMDKVQEKINEDDSNL